MPGAAVDRNGGPNRAMYEPEIDREKGTHATTTTGRPRADGQASIPTSTDDND